jgi:flavin reductase (DIM6/NTAB) family NADH-FMN oxidoreductase RutF
MMHADRIGVLNLPPDDRVTRSAVARLEGRSAADLQSGDALMDSAGSPRTDQLKDAMARVAGAVSVVTVGSGAERTGLTVTSMTSVSLNPPALLFCINRLSSAWPALRRCGCFAVNVLTARHKRLADQFAGRMGHDGPGRYAGAEWRVLATGAPILADALVAFDCEVDETIARHSHEIVVGRICATSEPKGGSPLIYWERGYEDIFLSRPPMADSERLAHAFEF